MKTEPDYTKPFDEDNGCYPPKEEGPSWVCADCGKKHGRQEPNPGATWHWGECGVCLEYNAVTEPRDFGHLRDGWDKDDDES